MLMIDHLFHYLYDSKLDVFHVLCAHCPTLLSQCLPELLKSDSAALECPKLAVAVRRYVYGTRVSMP